MKMQACVFLSAMTAGLLGGAAQADEPVKGLLYAHRGGAHEFEENTMDAFRKSYEKGIRGFETDVRITKDGEFVILHDDSLDRTHDATGHVEEKSAAELRSTKTKKGDQPLLFLDDLLTYFADKPGVYLEMEMKVGNKTLYPDSKLDGYCRKLVTAVQAKQPKDSTYVLASFDERPLKIVKEVAPETHLMLITGGPCSPELIKKGKELGVNRVAFQMNGSTRASVRAAQKAGLLTNGWPGHTLQDYYLAVGLGVDGICSDIPNTVQAWKLKHESSNGSR